MKKILLLLIIFTVLFSLSSCVFLKQEENNTAVYYYLANEISYGSENGLITIENVEIDPNDDLRSLLELYLDGPVSPSLKSPFPAKTKLSAISVDATHASLTLSREINRLSGIHLPVACACLAKTLFANTGVQSVTIYAEGGFSEFDGAITFTRDNIVIYDDSEAEISGS